MIKLSIKGVEVGEPQTHHQLVMEHSMVENIYKSIIGLLIIDLDGGGKKTSLQR
jgi:hypothetical protein